MTLVQIERTPPSWTDLLRFQVLLTTEALGCVSHVETYTYENTSNSITRSQQR